MERQRFVAALSRLRAPDVHTLACACGSFRTGTKAQLLERLHALAAARAGDAHKPLRLVSVDLGVKNLGVCQVRAPALAAPGATPPREPNSAAFSGRPTVERWFRTQLGADVQFAFPGFADLALDFARTLDAANADAVIVERQRARSTPKGNVPNDILRVNVVEGMVFAALRLLAPQTYLESVMPKYVVQFWRSPAEERALVQKREAQANYALAKKARRQLVEQWMQDPRLVFEHFVGDGTRVFDVRPGKKDDVNDALVQAITWLEWRSNSARLLANIEAGADPLEGLVLPSAGMLPHATAAASPGA